MLTFTGQLDDEHSFLKSRDFLIVIQTQHQKNMALQFGCKEACANSTHGTNAQDFTLYSLII